MEKMIRLLEEWNQQPVEYVTLGRIKMDAALQPRVERVVPLKDRSRYEALREEHLQRLRLVLDGGHSVELDPVLLADWGKGLFVVDGHHRVRAYRGESRPCIPARVMKVSKADAVLVSKLVNTQGVKLAMHREQSREACWQFLINASNRGEQLLANRKLASMFGINKDTVASMKRAMQRVNPAEYHPEFNDEWTGWPRWKDVRGNAWRGGIDAMSDDQRLQWQAEKIAKKLRGIVEGSDPAAVRLAIALIRQEDEFAKFERQQEAAQWQALIPEEDEQAA